MINASLELSNYVTVTKNNSHIYSPADIVNICKRKNNKKRDFLFVNSLQGKHLHAKPSQIFSLYDELVSEIICKIKSNEKIVVIGFAETATAIGHYIASSLPNCTYYMQTTRETVSNATPLLEFKEEHSHATEQFLYGNETELAHCDRVIFVDDEITTGNTILNFIHELEKLSIHAKFSVASFLNWQDDIWTEKFENLGITCFYILRGKINDINAKVNIEVKDTNTQMHIDNLNNANTTPTLLPTIMEVKNVFSNFEKERTGGKLVEFSKFETATFNSIIGSLPDDVVKELYEKGKSILVLGTEEYMFTPMTFANAIDVFTSSKTQFHATTRSPIETSSLPGYVIKTCYPIASCYDNNRNTFIYNLQKYDRVFIITDCLPNETFMKDISCALTQAGCDINHIHIIIMKG